MIDDLGLKLIMFMKNTLNYCTVIKINVISRMDFRHQKNL